jgi:hypothetical protein
LRFRALLAAGFAVTVGCEDSTPPAPNVAPNTEITGQIPTDGSSVPNHVQFEWRGTDADGTPAYFETILVQYPPNITRFEDIVVQVPAVDDPRWANGRVNGNRYTLLAPADILRVDPRTTSPPIVFDRWQSYFVRAIDNEGAIDESPAYRTYRAITEAPQLEVVAPAVVGQAVTLPRTVVLNWDGIDYIGSGLGAEQQLPSEARWVKLEATLDGTGQPLGFPDSLYNLTDDRWSPWAAWNTQNGRSAVLRDLVPAGPGQQAFVVAVQGRDDGGAITPQFDRTTPDANNYAVVIADGMEPVGPSITVFVRHATVDTLEIEGGTPPSFVVLAESDSVTVSWTRPDASRYGAGANDTRYGWDIANPSDDNAWTPWGTTRSALPQQVGIGHRFHLQARDDTGRGNPALHQVTSVVIQINPVLARRP